MHRFGRLSTSILWSHFFETWSQGEKCENAALAFSCGQRICILCVSMMPSPHPSTSSLWPLNPAMSHNNNNNGGLCACVCAAEDIDPIRVTRAKYYAPLPLRWAKKDYGQTTNHFRLLLVVLLLSVCIQHASFMHMLRLFFSVYGEFPAPSIGLEYELKHAESFTMDLFGRKYSWNDAKEDGGKNHFGTCGHGLKSLFFDSLPQW